MPAHCVDISLTNGIIDLFEGSAFHLSGTGANALICVTNLHCANQTPDASNDHAIKIDGPAFNVTFNNGRVFNNQKRGFSLESGPNQLAA